MSTFAGSPGNLGSTDGTGAEARFNYPQGIAIDRAGNLYVTDTSNHTIRKITPAGATSIFAGSSGTSGGDDGSGAAARFHHPQGIAIDTAGNLYVADTNNHTIRKITPAGAVSTVAGSAGNFGLLDGPVAFARFSSPVGIALDATGALFVSDASSYVIRKIAHGVVTTIGGLANNSGDTAGVGAAARFNGPRGLAVDASGNLFVADSTFLKIGTPSSQLAITVQPESLPAGIGSTASFRVTATGGAPISYQWLKNGVAIAGATTDTLTLASVQSSDAATYAVSVSNPIGTLVSNNATLTVLAAVPNDNFANAQPISGATGTATGANNGATGEPGEPLHASTVATASSVWFVWKAPETGTAVFDVPTTSFPVGYGAWRGNSLTALTRVTSGTGTRITFRAQSDTTYYLALGTTTPSIRGNFTLSWRMIPNDDFANARELTGDLGQLTANNLGATGEPGEPVHVSGTSAHQTSLWYRWTPSQSGLARLQLTTPPPASSRFPIYAQLVAAAYTGTTLDALNAVTTYRVNEQTGQSSAQVAYFPVTAGTTYRIAVGTQSFSNGDFTLDWRIGLAPVITSFNAPGTVIAGTDVEYRTTSLSHLPVTYQWFHNDVPIPGANSNVLSLPRVRPEQQGNYRVVADNGLGRADSSAAFTVLVPPANDNFADAQSLPALTGSITGSNFNATAEPNEPAHWNTAGSASSVWYRWTPSTSGLAIVDTVGSNFDTVLAVYTGATLANLTRVTQDDDRGGGRTSQVTFAATSGTTYHIAIGGSTPSARGNLTLNYQLTPALAITTPPAHQTVAAGGSATFTAQATGTGVRYQWYRNGQLIPGATNSTLVVGNIQGGDDAAFAVTVTNATGSVTSTPATLTVAPPNATSLALRHTLANADLLWSIAGNANTLVAVGSQGVILSSSDNGATWSARNSGTSVWLVAVTHGGGQFVVVGDSGTILTSVDGITFNRVASPGTTERLNNVLYADGKYVAVGEKGTVVTSVDARVWTPRSTPVKTWLHGLAWNPRIRHFATSGEAGVFLHSPDAVTWTRLPISGHTAALQHTVAVESYADFVTVGENGKVVSVRQNDLVLKDGQSLVTWSAEVRDTNTTSNLVGLTQGAGALFATSTDGKVITATSDRGPWYTVETGTGEYLLAGTYHNNSLYVVGQHQMIFQSQPMFRSRLANISTRGQVGRDSDVMISGFVITGDRPKQVLVRAAGPTLGSSFNLPDTLAQPVLTLADSNGRPLTANTGWSTHARATDIPGIATRVGAFPFAAKSADSAILAELNPGAYTAIISGVNHGTGLSIVEVYDTEPLSNEGARAINISTRGVAGSGANKLIAGFIIEGAAARRVLIRAVGPALAAAPFNVGGTLAEPQLELYNARSLLHATAGAWGLQPNADEIRGAAKSVSAFALPDGSKDSAMVVTLQPGAWTVQVGAPENTTGVVLVEVYALP